MKTWVQQDDTQMNRLQPAMMHMMAGVYGKYTTYSDWLERYYGDHFWFVMKPG